MYFKIKKNILHSSLIYAKGGIFKDLIFYRKIQEISVFWSSCLITMTVSVPGLQCQILFKAISNSPFIPTDVSTGFIWKHCVVTSKFFHALRDFSYEIILKTHVWTLKSSFNKNCVNHWQNGSERPGRHIWINKEMQFSGSLSEPKWNVNERKKNDSP